jgi:hypothetical protein
VHKDNRVAAAGLFVVELYAVVGRGVRHDEVAVAETEGYMMRGSGLTVCRKIATRSTSIEMR